MGECTRSGFCNFMHLKPISRELRRYLYSRGRGGRIGGGRSRTRSRSPQQQQQQRRRSRSPRNNRHRSRDRDGRRGRY